MQSRFLLYIDILGFTEIVKSNPNALEDIYQVIASLYLHDHSDFKAIVFSDTILVYTLNDIEKRHDKSYVIMYLCEFVHDLSNRLTGRNILFRAVIEYGDFTHFELNSIPCFFGQTLIRAYLSEKQINSIGLFISNSITKYCDIFKYSTFNEDYSFVFYTQHLEQLEREWGKFLPAPGYLIESTDTHYLVYPNLILVELLFNQAKGHTNSKVRAKSQNAYDFYLSKFPHVMKALEAANFSPTAISQDADWDSVSSRYPEDYSWAIKSKIIF